MARAKLEILPFSWRMPTLIRLARWIRMSGERRRQRRHLAELSDYLLRDVGLTPDDVRQELTRPPWR